MRSSNTPQSTSALRTGVLALGVVLCGGAGAQGIDAGGQANLMHQHELLRNQTTGNSDHLDSRRPAPVGNRLQWHRKNLRPEYERRVRVNGKADADAWFQRSLRGLLERDRRLGIPASTR